MNNRITWSFIKDFIIAVGYFCIFFILFFVYLYFKTRDSSGVLYLNLFSYSIIFTVYLFIAMLILEVVIKIFKQIKLYNSKAMFIAILVFLLTSYTIVGTLTLNTDRSFSSYLVTLVASKGELGISRVDLEQGFTNWHTGQDYLNRRIAEQTTMGLMYEKDGNYYSTKRGIWIANINIFSGNFFNLSKQNFLHK